ncbi:MAG: alpha/beta hydrolase [Chlamydiae bacterium]|nr:alpha/beta hydrolase [Chlamydiota bacterium]
MTSTIGTPSLLLKNFLETSEMIGSPGEGDEATWRLIRGFYRSGTEAMSLAAQEKYTAFSEETSIAGVQTLVVTPKDFSESSEKIVIYMHGGAFTLGSPDHLYQVFAQTAFETSRKVYAINYRLAPEHPFPSAVEDCLAVYTEITKTVDPINIAFLGDSAGGNLCLVTAMKVRDLGLKLPSSIALFSPVVTGESVESYTRNKDPRISFHGTIHPSWLAYKADPSHPDFNLLRGNVSGLPPIITLTGTRDALEDESILLEASVKSAGGEISRISLPHVPHGIVEFGDDIPEGVEMKSLASAFINKH